MDYFDVAIGVLVLVVLGFIIVDYLRKQAATKEKEEKSAKAIPGVYVKR